MSSDFTTVLDRVRFLPQPGGEHGQTLMLSSTFSGHLPGAGVRDSLLFLAGGKNIVGKMVQHCFTLCVNIFFFFVLDLLLLKLLLLLSVFSSLCCFQYIVLILTNDFFFCASNSQPHPQSRKGERKGQRVSKQHLVWESPSESRESGSTIAKP